MRTSRPLLLLSAVVAALAIATVPAEAQYFGQNKVQYRDFNFQVLKTKHFDIYYYPEERAQADQMSRLAERWYERYSKLFETNLDGRQPVILYASSADFRQTNALEGDIGEGTGGVTVSYRRRIIMPSAGSLAETNHVIGHEMVHAFQYDIADKMHSTGFMRLPLWVVEGQAEYLSIGPVDANTALWLRDALNSDKLPTLRDIGNPRFFPYRYGQAFWAYVGGRWGDKTGIRLFREAMRLGDMDAAISRVLKIKTKEFSKDWAASIRETYGPFLAKAKNPTDYGPVLIDKKRGGGDLNIGPAVSPDGKQIVYLSERDLFSVDLYLADTKTGKVVRKLVSTATDPHFDSLEFIESAGSWSRDGRRFVQGVVRKGRGALLVLDAETGKDLREVDFHDLDEVQTPSFAPDGQHVVFSAMKGGQIDLWTYDLKTGERRQYTNDAFAEYHPAISPDGKKIAIVTDRFSTNLKTLSYSNYRLALVDAATGEITPLPGYEGASHTNPQWSPDGKSLYFVSDVTGAYNVHRLDLATGQLYQVTDLRTGVAGITPLSPSISVAQDTGRLTYAARMDSNYSIYAIDPPALGGTADQKVAMNEATVTLPPRSEPGGLVYTMHADATDGLPPASETPPTEPYKAKLGLEFVGQPTVGVGVDRFGTFVGGGTSMYFSDMLGDENLGLSIQAYGSIKDTGGVLVYSNLKRKIDWAVGLQQLPYIFSGGFSQSLDSSGTQLLDQQLIERETFSTVFGLASLPLNRADRFELQPSFQRVGFSAQLYTDSYSALDGSYLGSSNQSLDTGLAPLYLGSVSGAFVHDTSVFGATSPIVGARGRFEVSPTFGTITYTNVLADYRRYFMPVRPVTVAFRVTHFGRYGSGSEDQRFGELYLGYPDLIRGYDGITSAECVPNATDPCHVYDQLFGSRILLGNFEVRAPLWGLFKGQLTYGPLPVEVALFADSGIAWTKGDKASFLGGDRKLLTSVGAALRVNVFGYLVVETSIAHPFERPGKSWVWQWSFSPGF
jgi:Tol biopolymer transport system component